MTRFQPGDPVVVKSGRLAGEVGTVIDVEDNACDPANAEAIENDYVVEFSGGARWSVFESNLEPRQ